MRVTVAIDDGSLYINGKLAQRMELGEQITIDGAKSEYRVIVYRKINKDKKIIKLADRKEAR
jgi:hypothetical protein